MLQTAFLGDAVLCIPLLKSLKKAYPSSSIVLVCRKGLGEFFCATGLVGSAIEVDKSDKNSFKAAFKSTKKYSYDLILSPHRSFRSALWTKRLHPKLSIGFKRSLGSLFFSKVVTYQKSQHDVMRQLSLMQPLGINLSTLSKEDLSLRVKLPTAALSPFAEYKNAVIISPGSQWNTKRWTLEGFTEVARVLGERGYKVVVVGTEAEKVLGDEISLKVPGVINLCGQTTVLELAILLSFSKVLICNDSGTMHLAASVGTAVVSIFGPTVRALGYSPWNENSRVVEIENLKCRPCGAHGHDKCPIGTHACMKLIDASVVLKNALEFLA